MSVSFIKKGNVLNKKKVENHIFVKDYTLIRFRTMIKTQMELIESNISFTVILSSWVTLHLICDNIKQF